MLFNMYSHCSWLWAFKMVLQTITNSKDVGTLCKTWTECDHLLICFHIHISHCCSPQAPKTVIQMVRPLRAPNAGSPSHQICLKVSRDQPQVLFPHALELQICSLLLFTEWYSLRTSVPCGIQYSVIPLTAVDCCSTGQNKEVVRDMGRERESNPCLKRSSEVLGPSPPSATVLDSNVVVRENSERRPSFEGDIIILLVNYKYDCFLFFWQEVLNMCCKVFLVQGKSITGGSGKPVRDHVLVAAIATNVGRLEQMCGGGGDLPRPPRLDWLIGPWVKRPISLQHRQLFYLTSSR